MLVVAANGADSERTGVARTDAAAILAMAVVIDEDHDEKDAKEEREKEEEKGGWPFG